MVVTTTPLMVAVLVDQVEVDMVVIVIKPDPGRDGTGGGAGDLGRLVAIILVEEMA